ncbi:ABC transporter permease [Alienimonas chondri]|uniref:ABC transporter permease n=1 Tax=Alienimonas chondri TaxID=2681879 RepID=UPI001488ECC4|nr:ABC transporter permease [Alienimonas chondri]
MIATGFDDRETVIRPPSGWPFPDFRELWQFRDLLSLLTLRSIAVRYRQSVLGVGWAIVRPVVSVLIFTLIFGKAAGFEDDLPSGVAYPVFAFLGLVPWMFFAAALGGTVQSVVGGSDMLTKVYFPRLVLPLSNLGVAAVDLGIQIVLVALLMAWYRIVPTAAIVALPAFLLLTALAALAGGLSLTALNVKYRDVGQAVPFFVQAGMYLSPVIYPPTFIPEKWSALYYLNPMAGAIEGVRWSVLGTDPPQWGYVGLSVVTTLALLAGGLIYFKRTESTFADVI